MIKLLPLIFVFITFIISAQSANRTYVPDDAFEQALIDLGYDDVLDDYVLTANINTITELDISQIERGGLNLTGIEDFIALEVLNCRSNSSVTNMNLNPLVHLEELNVLACWVAIDTSNNPELRILITGNPSFIGGPSLDLSNNPKLEVLLAGTEVDLSNNPLLKRLSFTEFAISQLDVSNNPELEYLNLGLDNFYLETIDLSNNPNLIELNLGETSIKSLDLSNNPRLERVYGSVKTNLEYLNLKSGSNQVLVEVTVNVSDCVQVDDVAYAEAQENWNVGVDRFSEDCSAPSPLTYVPDDNFEQALIDLGRDDVLDDYVATFSILAIDDLYLNDTTISDLTGIEDFVNLKELFLIDTPISQLDIRNLSDLEHLEIENTELTNVSTNENTSLNWVRLDGDIEFNLSNNRGLLYLTLENIAVRDLDFTLYPDLRYLNINSNETITRLNLSQNTLIRHLELRGNPSLQYLNLKNGNNTSLDYFQMHFNESVTCIEVDDVNYANNNGRFIIDSQAVFSEDCNDNGGATYVPDDNFEQALIDLGYDNELDDYVLTSNINTITELNIDEISRGSLDLTGIQDFVALRVLNCSSNAPIYGGSTTPFTLNTSQMLQLEELYVYDSYLTIDTSNNPELRVLITGSSTLGAGSPILDVTQNPKLEELRAGKPVDLTNNPLLRWLHFGPFTLSSLDLSNNTELEVLNLGIENLGLEELDLSNNPKLIELVLGETGIRSLDLSNNTLLEKVHRGSFYSNLEYLNLKNGNNQILTDVDARVSGCVQVDDVAYAEAQTNWFIGSGRYSENCFEDLTYVPDDAFEQALIDRGYDDVLDDFVLPSNILPISDLNINSIAG